MIVNPHPTPSRKRIMVLVKNGMTFLILDVFTFIALTLVNLMPAIYDVVEKDYNLPSAVPIMLMEAFFVIGAALMAVFWGYTIDKKDRRKVLFWGLSIWIIGIGICLIAPTFPIFFIGRLITAAGIGVQMPSVYSIMADIVPAKYWSTLYGGLALLTALANTMGNFLSGFLSPLNIWGLGWKFPFALFILASLFCFGLLLLVNLPHRGAGDPWIGDQIKKGSIAYTYTIKKEDLAPLWRIPTNRYMSYLSFFAVIPGATMGSFLIYYFTTGPFNTFPANIRTPIAAIFAGMVGVGYISGTLFLGPLFDWLHSKAVFQRARFTFWGLVFGLPLLISGFLCIKEVNYNELGLNLDPFDASISIPKYVEIVTAIFENNPSYIPYFFLILFGTFIIAPITINRTPTLLEVNLPEHMGTSQSLLNLSDQLGKGFTFIFLAFQFVIYEWLFNRVEGLVLIIASTLFYLVPIWWWRRISIVIRQDVEKKKETLLERMNSSSP